MKFPFVMLKYQIIKNKSNNRDIILLYRKQYIILWKDVFKDLNKWGDKINF